MRGMGVLGSVPRRQKDEQKNGQELERVTFNNRGRRAAGS